MKNWKAHHLVIHYIALTLGYVAGALLLLVAAISAGRALDTAIPGSIGFLFGAAGAVVIYLLVYFSVVEYLEANEADQPEDHLRATPDE